MFWRIREKGGVLRMMQLVDESVPCLLEVVDLQLLSQLTTNPGHAKPEHILVSEKVARGKTQTKKKLELLY